MKEAWNKIPFFVKILMAIMACLIAWMGYNLISPYFSDKAHVESAVQEYNRLHLELYKDPSNDELYDELKSRCVGGIIPGDTHQLIAKARRTESHVVISEWAPKTEIVSIEIKVDDDGNKIAVVETREWWFLAWLSGLLSVQENNPHTYNLIKTNKGWLVKSESWRSQYRVMSRIIYE